jgi:hypothetical protein
MVEPEGARVAAAGEQTRSARRISRAIPACDATVALLAGLERALDVVDQQLHDGGELPLVDLAWVVHDTAQLPGRPCAAVRARAAALARRLAPLARDDGVRAEVIRRPGDVLELAAAHVVLREGCPDRAFDQLVTEAMHEPSARSGERLPHELVGQAALRARLVGALVAPAVRPLVSATVLASGLDVVGDDAAAARSLVATLAYATDGGQVVEDLARSVPTVLAEVRSALAGALDHDDVALAATLLRAWPLVQRPLCRVARFALDLVLDASSTGRASPEAAVAVGRLAAALLVAASTRDARTIVREANVERARRRLAIDGRGYLAALLGFTAGPTPSPPWRVRAGALPDADLVLLAPLLVDVALRRAVAAGDDATARAVLALVVDHGLTVTPVAQQAASIVRRLSIERSRQLSPR